MSNGNVYVNLDGLAALLPLGFQVWNQLTSKEAFKLPDNFTELDASQKSDVIMAFLQEKNKRDNLSNLMESLPSALKVAMGILGNTGVVSQPLMTGNTAPQYQNAPALNGGGQSAPPPAPARR